ncbi:MAG: allophanate hydrolase [Thiohalomonadaceae bacterium]
MANPASETLGIKAWRELFQDNFAAASKALRAQCAGIDADDPAWIHRITDQELEAELLRIQALSSDLPLYGVPFAIKDNIDARGWPTTAACPDYAYTAQQDAFVVECLRAAGAILLGKTNLDQFATGLVGTRSPYGEVPNSFDPDYISGGSSSGSAVAVARGQVAFSLGTDTAGSGRVPAGFNNIIGFKPTRGALSTRGVVPACASLDCVSIFAANLEDVEAVLGAAMLPDKQDCWSRSAPKKLHTQAPQRLAVPVDAQWYGDTDQALAWQAALQEAVAAGFELVPIDFSPFFELAALLYEGPWVAERWVAVGEFIAAQPESVNPVVLGIISQGQGFTAVDQFRAEYRREALLKTIATIFEDVDALLVPTTPSFPSRAAVAAEPLKRNSELGRYTNFVNLADLCAISLPAGFRKDGLPFGITLISQTWQHRALFEFATRWQAQLPWTQGVSGVPATQADLDILKPAGHVLAVVGAHLRGQPLNHQLLSRGARFLETTRSSHDYRLYALANTQPAKPGLSHSPGSAVAGQGIELELWSLDSTALGELLMEVPPPLGLGTVQLADGRQVKGFICEGYALHDATDITAYGGWRAWLASNK